MAGSSGVQQQRLNCAAGDCRCRRAERAEMGGGGGGRAAKDCAMKEVQYATGEECRGAEAAQALDGCRLTAWERSGAGMSGGGGGGGGGFLWWSWEIEGTPSSRRAAGGENLLMGAKFHYCSEFPALQQLFFCKIKTKLK